MFNNVLKKIFSVTNNNIHVVIEIFGIKIKLLNAKFLKQKYFEHKDIISKYELQTKLSEAKCLKYDELISKYELKPERYKRVITYGTFDVLHFGHINLLKRAKALGDYLIVALSGDEFNAIKNKKSYYTYEQRKTILEACRYVDLVIPENNWEQKIDDIKKYQADIFVMGDDWKGKFDYLKDYCEVIYLPRTPDVSSTQTKKYLNMNNHGF